MTSSMGLLSTALMSFFVATSPTDDRVLQRFVVGKWKVDLLDTKLPSNATVEELERATKSLAKAWLTIRADGRFTMFLDRQESGKWRIKSANLILTFKQSAVNKWQIDRKKKQITYGFKIERGLIYFAMKKVG